MLPIKKKRKNTALQTAAKKGMIQPEFLWTLEFSHDPKCEPCIFEMIQIPNGDFCSTKLGIVLAAVTCGAHTCGLQAEQLCGSHMGKIHCVSTVGDDILNWIGTCYN